MVRRLRRLTQIFGNVRRTLNYLKATQHERALVINFGSPSLQYKRLIFFNSRKLAQP